MRLEMKTHLLLLLALLLSTGCGGERLELAANRALGAALAEVNAVYAAGRLYRVTRGSLAKVMPAGQNTVDLLLKFGIKETECATTSGSDPQTCAFRSGFFAPSSSCSARVRVSAASAQVLHVRCAGDSSSSSESSEEVFLRRRNQFLAPFPSRDVAPSLPPAQTEPLQQRPDVQPRGDTFSNYLE